MKKAEPVVNSTEITIHLTDAKVFVNDSEVVKADFKTDNDLVQGQSWAGKIKA